MVAAAVVEAATDGDGADGGAGMKVAAMAVKAIHTWPSWARHTATSPVESSLQSKGDALAMYVCVDVGERLAGCVGGCVRAWVRACVCIDGSESSMAVTRAARWLAAVRSRLMSMD